MTGKLTATSERIGLKEIAKIDTLHFEHAPNHQIHQIRFSLKVRYLEHRQMNRFEI